MNTRAYWIGFNHVAGIGPQRLKRLQEHFQSLDAAWHASAEELRRAGLDRRSIENLVATRATLDLAAIQTQLDDLGVAVLTLEDPDYPSLLRELPDAPPVLYIRGTLTAADAWAVAIVGTRKASQLGRNMAHQLGRELAEQGITVISGLALGIDAAAHRGALEGGGRTIAVLPCGIDVIYPPQHRNLAAEIANQGALLTEFPPGTQAESKNFAPRNRLISGLALGVVVAEAPEKSGALLTADSAAEQGREVFAVPGPPASPLNRGANRLIQEGAKLVMTVDDILEELNLTRNTPQTRAVVQELAPENDLERCILEALQSTPTALHIDELCRHCGRPVAEVSGTLMLMELKGMVQQAGTMQYSLAGPRQSYRVD
ncbi:MAG: DNA-processing protein DprA [Anaerolineae bacterium]